MEIDHFYTIELLNGREGFVVVGKMCSKIGEKNNELVNIKR